MAARPRARPVLLLLLGAAAVCGAAACAGGAQPLLWRATPEGGNGRWAAYVVGVHAPGPLEAGPAALPAAVRRALACADVAYFRLACSRRPGGGLGGFLDHCTAYGPAEPADSLAARLGAEDLAALQRSAGQLLGRAPARCRGGRAWSLANHTLGALGGGTDRTTLRAFHRQVAAAVDPGSCAQEAGQSREDLARDLFGGSRPSFGLVDVEEECLLTRAGSVREEAQLARRLAAAFGNASWLRAGAEARRAAAAAAGCGDLGALELLLERGGGEGRAAAQLELPWGAPSELNPSLADGIVRARSRDPDRVAVVVLDVMHLVDVGSAGIKGVPSLLRERGLVVERLQADSLAACGSSGYQAPGAREQDNCLMPPRLSQPASCTKFGEVFDRMIVGDPMQGRVKREAGCNKCKTSEQSCTCQFDWENDAAFTELCENTFVDGTYGQVLLLDLTRNPGSTRRGQFEAEKTVRGLHQGCYARSCQAELTRLMIQRKWHANDSTLASARAELRCPDGGGGCLAEPRPGPASVRVLRDAPPARAARGLPGARLLAALGTLAALAALAGGLAKHPRCARGLLAPSRLAGRRRAVAAP
ncbi:unnamed protein product, partial [Prorocentrum cordatum]